MMAERLCEAMSSGQELESLCYVEDDWVREVFVVDRELPVGMDWWSLTLAEETGASAEGRSQARTCRAVRQTIAVHTTNE